MAEYRNNIGDARRAYEKREHVKYPQKDAAAEFGVSLSTYRNYEQQKSIPNGRVASEIADKYGVTVNYLLAMPPAEEGAEVGLTSDERELVSLYRNLPPSMRGAMLSMMREAAKK